MSLSSDEFVRYSRHLTLPTFGQTGQERLKQSSVLVIGCGGLGAPLLQYLVAAGVGTIGIVDYDRVELSNLQRQVLFNVQDIGNYKTTSAIRKLRNLNPHVQFVEYRYELNVQNAMDILKNYDVIADGTDNFPTRYMVNDACVLLGKPLIYGSIYRYEGQVSVFNSMDESGKRGPNYRDLFPSPPPPDMVPDCAEGGVLGVLPGIIGSIQGLEVIKLITGVGELLAGKLFIWDGLDTSSRTIRIPKDPANPISGPQPTITELIDYEVFCGMSKSEQNNSEDMDVQTLKNWMDTNKAHQLIDIREPHEWQAGRIGGVHIPKSQLKGRIDEIKSDVPVVVYCRSGMRSRLAIRQLSRKHGFGNLVNLDGGIKAWKKFVDPNVVVV